jgi:neutral amino acid transport system permease protein
MPVRHVVRVLRGALPAATAPLLASAIAALFLLVLSAPAFATPVPTPSATAGTGETLQGRLVNEGEPLEGVTVTVAAADGTDVGEAESDADGAFVVPLPEAGEYTITLDEDTLPEGVAIREGRSAEVTLPVAVGQQRNVLFPLGEGTRNVQSDLDRLPTLAVEGLQFGLIIALAAVGLSVIYGTTGLTNFAHGELITLGALLAYWIYDNGRMPFLLAGLLAVVAAGVLGGAQDRLLWRPLRKRGTGLIAMLVVTIGLALFLRYFFLYLFGGASQPFRAYESQSPLDLGPVDITPRALISMTIAIVVLLAVAFALLRTRIGKATRAVADNPSLASSSGIDVERVIQVVWIAGAALAGLAGILLGMAQQVSFQLGFQILLLVFAAVTLGGLGTAFGALVGSLIVGIFTQVSTLFIPSELKNAGALAILILILLVRPQGILGRPERVG